MNLMVKLLLVVSYCFGLNLSGMENSSNSPNDNNEMDPITLQEFREIDQKEIIVLNGFYYHLPALYHWVFNLENNRDPRTNIPFTNEIMAEIHRKAQEIFPLKLNQLTLMNSLGPIITTSLISVYQLARLLVGMVPESSRGGGKFSLLNLLANSEYFYIISLNNDSRSILSLLDTGMNYRVNDFFGQFNELNVLMVRLLPPPRALEKFSLLLKIARDNNLPSENFEQELISLQKICNSK